MRSDYLQIVCPGAPLQDDHRQITGQRRYGRVDQ